MNLQAETKTITSGSTFICRRCGCLVTVGRALSIEEAIKHVCIGARRVVPTVDSRGNPIGDNWY